MWYAHWTFTVWFRSEFDYSQVNYVRKKGRQNQNHI
ncbi:hypothetical protein HMPREF0999_00124 [Parabacteroides sp. D25]|nr:hypothetical protein HMPREF0999_00124 [Parabacteroides sp. D25]KMW35308.1 hypothetical protein BSDG_04625 [Parabacteroides sp. 2_1_7]